MLLYLMILFSTLILSQSTEYPSNYRIGVASAKRPMVDKTRFLWKLTFSADYGTFDILICRPVCIFVCWTREKPIICLSVNVFSDYARLRRPTPERVERPPAISFVSRRAACAVLLFASLSHRRGTSSWSFALLLLPLPSVL